MPGSRQQRVPDTNILDLRRLLQEQATAVDHPRHRRWIQKRLEKKSKPPAHHRPPGRETDWVRVRRETMKFCVVVTLIGLPVLAVFGIVRVVRAAALTEQLAVRGAEYLQRGGQAIAAFDSEAAAEAFQNAEAVFEQAEKGLTSSVWSQTRAVSRLPLVGKKFQTGLATVRAARSLSVAGQVFSGSLTGVEPAQTGLGLQTDGIIQGSVGVLGPLLRQPQSFRTGLASVIEALEQLAFIDLNTVPAHYRETVRTWQRLQPLVTSPDDRGGNLADFLTSMLAGDQTKEWLIVFQNHDELRATGGFIGTYMMVKFEKGVFKVLDAPVTGPFDLTLQIPQTTAPPQPILAVAPYWTFHDANWFLDVPTSSEFLLDFYAQARGFKPDGIIYLTPGIVESLLRITGPLRPEGYGVDITADNFVRATEEQVEFKYNKALNNPKEFVIDLVPALISGLTKLDASDGMLAVGAALQHADQADMLFYSRDDVTQKSIAALGWSGRLLDAPDDYLAVVTSNLGGGKTDRVIDEDVKVTVQPEARGLVHTVAITRTHRGEPNNPLTSRTNSSFLRVYAPAEAQFIQVEGASSTTGLFFEPKAGTAPTQKLLAAEGTVLFDHSGGVRITNENGRKTFGAWSVIAPGESQTVTFSYTTPLPEDQTWSLVWQKQPGTPRRTWHLTYLPGSNETVREVLGNGQREGRNAVWSTDSDRHRAFGVVTSKK